MGNPSFDGMVFHSPFIKIELSERRKEALIHIVYIASTVRCVCIIIGILFISMVSIVCMIRFIYMLDDGCEG